MPTHKSREPIPAAPAGYESVEFDAADGLKLSGWYAPSRNGAAVVLVHGGGGNRTGPLDHAQLLRRHGYGVLLYDSRGRGESDGTPDAWGPLFLIAAGGFATEIDFNRHYADGAKEPFTYWELPAVGHTAAVRQRPKEYERRLIAFFDDALRPRR